MSCFKLYREAERFPSAVLPPKARRQGLTSQGEVSRWQALGCSVGCGGFGDDRMTPELKHLETKTAGENPASQI